MPSAVTFGLILGTKLWFVGTELTPRFPFAPRDFDANLYLCEEAFGLLPLDTFGRLADTLLFHAHVFVLCVTATAALAVALRNLRCGGRQNPGLCPWELTRVTESAVGLPGGCLPGWLCRRRGGLGLGGSSRRLRTESDLWGGAPQCVTVTSE